MCAQHFPLLLPLSFINFKSKIKQKEIENPYLKVSLSENLNLPFFFVEKTLFFCNVLVFLFLIFFTKKKSFCSVISAVLKILYNVRLRFYGSLNLFLLWFFRWCFLK